MSRSGNLKLIPFLAGVSTSNLPSVFGANLTPPTNFENSPPTSTVFLRLTSHQCLGTTPHFLQGNFSGQHIYRSVLFNTSVINTIFIMTGHFICTSVLFQGLLQQCHSLQTKTILIILSIHIQSDLQTIFYQTGSRIVHYIT